MGLEKIDIDSYGKNKSHKSKRHDHERDRSVSVDRRERRRDDRGRHRDHDLEANGGSERKSDRGRARDEDSDDDGSDFDDDSDCSSEYSHTSSRGPKDFLWNNIGWIILVIVIVVCAIALYYFFSYRPRAQQAEMYNEREHLYNYSKPDEPRNEPDEEPRKFARQAPPPQQRNAKDRIRQLQEAKEARAKAVAAAQAAQADSNIVEIDEAANEGGYTKVRFADDQSVDVQLAGPPESEGANGASSDNGDNGGLIWTHE